MPVSILFTIPNLITAGSGKALYNIASRLDRNRYTPHLCVQKRGGDLEKKFRQAGIPVLESPFTTSALPYYSLYGRLQALAPAFKKKPFQLWHSFHYLDDYTEALLARMCGAKWIYTKKNMNWHTRAWTVRSWLAGGIITQNTDMETFFHPHFALRKKTRMRIPRGIDTKAFHPEQTPASRYRERYGIPKDKRVVGCIANLLPGKGQDILIQAMHGLPNYHLFLAGPALDPDYKQQLERQCRDLRLEDRVHFLGSLKKVAQLLKEIDIFAFPSLKEGCPVALLEAMCMGKACVASDVPGNRDIIEDGVNGLSFQARESGNLRHHLKNLLNDELRNKLGAQARSTILEGYEIEREVQAHEDFYQEILNN